MIELIFAEIKDGITFPESTPTFYTGYGEPPKNVKDCINALFQGVVKDYVASLIDTPLDVVRDTFEVFCRV